MSNARYATMAAIFQKLMGDATLLGMLGEPRIVDRPGRNVALPMVTFGRISTERDGSSGPEVQTHTLEIDVYGEQARGEVSEICEMIANHLDGASLNVAGYQVVLIRHIDTTIDTSSKLRSFRGRNRFRFLTEALA